MNVSSGKRLAVGVGSLCGFLAVSGSAGAEVRTVTSVDEFTRVLAEVVAGDEVVVESGEYAVAGTLEATLDGTVDAPIVIRAAAGATPVISSSAAGGAALSFSGSFVSVLDLAFDGAGVAISASGENLLFAGLTVTNAATGIQCNGCANWSVESSEFSMIRTGAAVLAESSSAGSLRGNWVHGLDADGFVVSGTSTSVFDNVIEGVIGEAIVVTETSVDGSTSDVVGNFAHGGGVVAAGPAAIANNIVWQATGYGISSDLSQNAGGASVTVTHNTVVSAATSCFHALDWPLSSGSLVVSNNIFYCPNTAAVFYESGTSETLVMVGNVYLGTADFPGDSVLGGAIDADFEDPREGNFYPTAASPFMDKGDPTYTVAADFDGTPRGGTPDVGAYERAAAMNPNPVPGGTFKGAGPGGGGDVVDGDVGVVGEDSGNGGQGDGGFAGIGKGPAGTGDFPERDEGCQCSTSSRGAVPVTLAVLLLLAGAILRRRSTSV